MNITYDIKGLSKSYQKSSVFKDISLQFRSGSLVALMGRNGSGKSTLMRLLAQQDTFDFGEILFMGETLKTTSVKIGERLVYISEDQELPFNISLNDWSQYFKKLSLNSYDDSLFKKLAEDLNLDCAKPFHQLSRGQKMKAFFALQAPMKPDVYLLDEITSVLDAGSRLSLMQFIKTESARGATVIISTNIASEMQGFATDICFLSEKGIELFCPVSDLNKIFAKLRSNPGSGAKRVHLNSDGSWSYLIERSKLVGSHEEDRRGITVEDILVFFSGEGEGK